MTTQTQNKNFSFDGFGINGADQYSSRLANLTQYGQKQNVGRLFAAAPELLEALEEFLACGPNAGYNQDLIDQVKKAISKAKGKL